MTIKKANEILKNNGSDAKILKIEGSSLYHVEYKEGGKLYPCQSDSNLRSIIIKLVGKVEELKREVKPDAVDNKYEIDIDIMGL